MVSVRVSFSGVFLFILVVVYILGDDFHKTIIPLALVGHEIVIAESALPARLVGYLAFHIQCALVK